MAGSRLRENVSDVIVLAVVSMGFFGGLWLLYWYEGPLERLGLFLALAAAVVGVVYSRLSLPAVR